MSIFSREQLYNTNNTKRSLGLFKETSLRPDHVICTLMSFDPKLPRLIDLYVSYCSNDPSEYEFATAVFGDWSFWDNIRTKTWFKEYYDSFKAEAEVKRKSKAFKTLVEEAEKGGPTGINAAKFLITEPWKEKTRASKTQTAKTTQTAKSEYSADLKRLKELGLMDTPKH